MLLLLLSSLNVRPDITLSGFISTCFNNNCFFLYLVSFLLRMLGFVSLLFCAFSFCFPWLFIWFSIFFPYGTRSPCLSLLLSFLVLCMISLNSYWSLDIWMVLYVQLFRLLTCIFSISGLRCLFIVFFRKASAILLSDLIFPFYCVNLFAASDSSALRHSQNITLSHSACKSFQSIIESIRSQN